MIVPFVDLKAQYETIASEIDEALRRVVADTNFILAGYIVEKITHRSLYNQVREQILRPLKLNDTIPSVSRTLPSPPALATVRPSDDRANVSVSSGTRARLISLPRSASHVRMLPSLPKEVRVLPSGE